MKKSDLRVAVMEFWQLLKRKDFHSLLSAPTQNVVTQFLRYIFVGMVSFFIDFYFLYLLESLGMHYLPAAGFAFSIGIGVNFILTKFFVFKQVDPTVGPTAEIAVFLAIAIVGLVLTELLMFYFTGHLHIYFMTSKFISSLLVFLWNFLGRKLILYRGTLREPAPQRQPFAPQEEPTRQAAPERVAFRDPPQQTMHITRASQSTSSSGN